MPRETCRGTKDDGTPCESPIVKGDGYCPAHGPSGRERMSEIARKGGEATARKRRGGGLDPEDLPPLDSPQAAERWLEAVGRAVATGQLGHNEGRTVVRAVREFLRAHDAGEVAEKLERLESAIRESRKRGGDVTPILELVEGEAADA